MKPLLYLMLLAFGKLPSSFARTVPAFSGSLPALSEQSELDPPPVALPLTVLQENWPCEYRGKEWITFDLRLYPKWADRKGLLKTFAIRFKDGDKEISGFRKTCVYKVIDFKKNRFEQAIETRIVTHGPYHIWRKDGLMVESGKHVDSVQEGTLTQYDSYGRVARTMSFEKGIKNGEERYISQEQKACRDLYERGNLTRHICYFANSAVVYKDESYANGFKHGRVIVNFPDGRPEWIEHWQHGAYHGIVQQFLSFPDRYFLYTESVYEKGVKQGATMIWDGEGRRLQ